MGGGGGELVSLEFYRELIQTRNYNLQQPDTKAVIFIKNKVILCFSSGYTFLKFYNYFFIYPQVSV